MRLARWNHREAVLVLVDDAIEDDRTGMLDHLADRLIELARIAAADAVRPVGFGELDEIRQRLRIALGITPAMQQFLPLAYHPHIFVVEDEYLHRQPILRRRGHF